MIKITHWVSSPQNIVRLLRWTALVFFIASLIAPTGFFAVDDSGASKWWASLILGVTALGSISEGGPSNLWVFAIPLSGLANVFVLYYLLAWNAQFKTARFVISCIGFVLQIVVLILMQSQHSFTSNVTHSIGIGYLLWMGSYAVTAIGMILKYRTIERHRVPKPPIETGIA